MSSNITPKGYFIRHLIFFFCLLINAFSFAQMRPIGKVCIQEGVVADRETNKPIPFAVLYSDSLGITTTSDENGYFKIVVPLDLFMQRQFIRIDVVKTGYKRMGTGFHYNAEITDTSKGWISKDTAVIWRNHVLTILLSVNKNPRGSESGESNYANESARGYAAVKQTFDENVAEEMREKKLDELSEGNEMVYFQLDSVAALVTRRYTIMVFGKFNEVFIDDKRVAVSDINKMVKRNEIRYDGKKSTLLSKKYGKETIALTTAPDPKPIDPSITAILEIDLDN